MTERKCPNCRSIEWFPGAACWHCGWEANPDEQGHTWSIDFNGESQHERFRLPAPVCLQCGVVQRADRKNSKCRGKVYVTLRKEGA